MARTAVAIEEIVVNMSALRRFWTPVAVAVAVALAVCAATGIASATSPEPPPPPAQPATGPCTYIPTPEEPPARPVSLPRDAQRAPSRGTVHAVLITNYGLIDLTLDRAKARCAVQSFLHLTRSGFFTWTQCHRLTAYPTLKVVQCGDPSGTGAGGPGYRFADELPTDLPPAPTDPTGARRVYARGTLAMANAGPDTNGSQFFMVHADSSLRPSYTVFGRVGARGLATLDRIAAAGIAATPDDPAPVNGRPASPVRILIAAG